MARSINGHTIVIDGGSLTCGYPALLTGLANPQRMMIGGRRSCWLLFSQRMSALNVRRSLHWRSPATLM
jgi:hypothetical protein